MASETERRAQIDRTVKHMVSSGADYKYAIKKAKESAKRADRRDKK